MFGKSRYDQKIEDLEATIRSLRERLERVEMRTEPFRVGEDPYRHSYVWYPGIRDLRPTVTHEKAIKMLLEHCGLQFKKIPGTEECVVLEKKPKAKAA